MSAAKCPICGKEALPRSKNPSGPFCSPRCRTIDLGKWLDGAYRVPVEEALAEAERLKNRERAS